MENESRDMWRKAGSLGAVGLEMGIAVAFGYFIGNALDDWLGTSPWLTIFWVIAGVGAGFKALLMATRKARKVMESPADDNSDKDLSD
ncbi:MAG: AtpZ/AtpI family protein [Candidatus Alcyoniella australis]|nr:AtpZ/AtpI family protein [Candidatus Alcyoniella australis]